MAADEQVEADWFDEDGEFTPSTYVEELAQWLENFDDPNLVLVDDVWWVRSDAERDEMEPDPPPSDERLAEVRAEVDAYFAAEQAARAFEADRATGDDPDESLLAVKAEVDDSQAGADDYADANGEDPIDWNETPHPSLWDSETVIVRRQPDPPVYEGRSQPDS